MSPRRILLALAVVAVAAAIGWLADRAFRETPPPPATTPAPTPVVAATAAPALRAPAATTAPTLPATASAPLPSATASAPPPSAPRPAAAAGTPTPRGAATAAAEEADAPAATAAAAPPPLAPTGTAAAAASPTPAAGGTAAPPFAALPPVSDCLTRLSAHLAAMKRADSLALRRGLSGRVKIRLRVDADGAPQDLAVAVSSGSAPLDAEALEIARRAAPLPRCAGTVTVPIDLAIDAP